MMSIMMRLLLKKMGQKSDCNREMFHIECHIWGLRSPTCGSASITLSSGIVGLLTSSLMRGGAIDYYSNNVQVAHDGALG